MADYATQSAALPYRKAVEEKGLRPRRYNGIVHFAGTNLLAFGTIVLCASGLNNVQPLEWLAMPLSFLLANVVEWLAHRGPMHNRRPYMDIVFQRHTLTHHEYFHHDTMETDSHREWYYVLFPVWGIAAIFLPAIPVGLLAWWLLSANIALLFLIVAAGYYILYEWLHLLYHLSEEHWLANTALVRRLRRHHQHHHNKRLMQRYNFNVTFPIADYLFGTAYRPPAETPAGKAYQTDSMPATAEGKQKT
jgi:sterol desaturase/sphingolipid hydroxylase (fatty acid hydroxylase superfamily)